jgi:phosphoenolpyruvate carboxylase
MTSFKVIPTLIEFMWDHREAAPLDAMKKCAKDNPNLHPFFVSDGSDTNLIVFAIRSEEVKRAAKKLENMKVIPTNMAWIISRFKK